MQRYRRTYKASTKRGVQTDTLVSQMSESIVQERVCQYLRAQYPQVLFHSDFGSGIKLTQGQALRNQKIQKKPGWPDMFIPEPRGEYRGLFIELKAPGVVVYKKDGTLRKDKHLKAQEEYLSDLTVRGYKACFCIGFEAAKETIDNYLTNNNEH